MLLVIVFIFLLALFGILFKILWYLLLVLVALLVLFIVVTGIRQSIAFYSKANCGVCGKPTGYWGNKRFTLADGYACQSCLSKMFLDPNLDDFGPAAQKDLTVNELSSKIQYRAEVGEELWAAEKNRERF